MIKNTLKRLFQFLQKEILNIKLLNKLLLSQPEAQETQKQCMMMFYLNKLTD